MRGCVMPGVIMRAFLLVPFLGQLIFVRKINTVSLRFWRSEADGPRQMRGGAGRRERQQLPQDCHSPPDETRGGFGWRRSVPRFMMYCLSVVVKHTPKFVSRDCCYLGGYGAEQIYRSTYWLHPRTTVLVTLYYPCFYDLCSSFTVFADVWSKRQIPVSFKWDITSNLKSSWSRRNLNSYFNLSSSRLLWYLPTVNMASSRNLYLTLQRISKWCLIKV